ncbi:16S rRNA (adenine(1518)-N(6)/adenine(1519)-N(6))-dimethyltransferase RsmA [Corynebacterium poyangense]|uniref:Ribosomal RNA small subunit methyltransferase A n=1 Tax=Corynebacterium poyangense TaxID=2684405 RepID=A0A7H0SMX9_9CORY|nr:16S rRNA (adenine(1518)-N(6)/adenine(1519)-N(6))-dimethyltransferase RsmA [Corynebacterium poyangense]MBZ8176264.1 16S rRNA (adenine(1518)-N(6)/adenine(1519)-N(6))-dimethyltransferase RsmA [Corynebacterium poyangense]QNQ89904.1 16S rRNA (adenine(1518)-N(6)/adenine(1519)-N(6))-dimethyltransferase RsmA [Corynebacterium poyangense]
MAQLLGPADIRRLAAELDISPTKKLGQNFVHDPNSVRRIVAAADVGNQDHVLEVGPGLGSLTLGLLGAVDCLSAVEIDPRLASRLTETVTDYAPEFISRLRVINKDALHLESGDLSPTAVVANLPYNVAVPVLLHVLATFPTIRRVLVMVQAEVADRLAAQPGSKIYGVPSVKASYYGQVRRAGSIGKNIFWPAPNVDSGLVRIDCYRKDEAPWEISTAQRSQLFPLIDAAFAQRRKTLRAALTGFFGSGAAAEEALKLAGIDPKERGEKLTVADFIRLAEVSK